MKNLNILICEGNTPEEGKIFQDVGIPTHTESLKESLAYYNQNLKIDVLNPCLELDLNEIVPKLKKYDGLIWGGSSLNIYNDTPEIRRQISFMKECFKNVKKILAICWGMQVAVTAAGGEVKKGINGSHIGIANDIELTNDGLNNLLYKDKKNKFNTPAFNFDEVVTTPLVQYIWHQIKLIRYKVLILKLVLVKFGVYNIIQRLLIKKWLILLNSEKMH